MRLGDRGRSDSGLERTTDMLTPRHLFTKTHVLTYTDLRHGMRVSFTRAGTPVWDSRVAVTSPGYVTFCQNQIAGAETPEFGYIFGRRVTRNTLNPFFYQNLRATHLVCPECEGKL